MLNLKENSCAKGLIDSYVVIGKELWLSEEIGSAQFFRADYTSFIGDRHSNGGGIFVYCVVICIVCVNCIVLCIVCV